MMQNLITCILVICQFFIVHHVAYADGIRLEQTRIIFESGAKNEVATVSNDDNSPYLIQMGVTTQVDGGKTNLFAITPPLFRLNANSKFSARIFLKDKNTLPSDRESIFYLNTRAIPSTSSTSEIAQNNAKLVFVTNIVIKLFYRPEGIQAPTEQTYSQVTLQEKGEEWLFDNPTENYMTLINIKVNNNAYQHSVLVAPFSQTKINRFSGHIERASWQMINDFGGMTTTYHYSQLNNQVHSK